jgi:hypothetical protein
MVPEVDALEANWSLMEEECRRRPSMLPLLIVILLMVLGGSLGTLYCFKKKLLWFSKPHQPNEVLTLKDIELGPLKAKDTPTSTSDPPKVATLPKEVESPPKL